MLLQGKTWSPGPPGIGDLRKNATRAREIQPYRFLSLILGWAWDYERSFCNSFESFPSFCFALLHVTLMFNFQRLLYQLLIFL
jgi:hypothetical protein